MTTNEKALLDYILGVNHPVDPTVEKLATLVRDERRRFIVFYVSDGLVAGQERYGQKPAWQWAVLDRAEYKRAVSYSNSESDARRLADALNAANPLGPAL